MDSSSTTPITTTLAAVGCFVPAASRELTSTDVNSRRCREEPVKTQGNVTSWTAWCARACQRGRRSLLPTDSPRRRRDTRPSPLSRRASGSRASRTARARTAPSRQRAPAPHPTKRKSANPKAETVPRSLSARASIGARPRHMAKSLRGFCLSGFCFLSRRVGFPRAYSSSSAARCAG